MDKILTLIVPSYNMEAYLPYCLDSLLVKKGFDSFEVLVINDGSRDRTSEIAHGYEMAYPGVFRVIDKENGNYGSCVNRGLGEAQGKYVKILDADDSFNTGNFEKYLAFLRLTDADLVLSDFAVVDTGRNVRKVIRYDLGQGELYSMDDVCTCHAFKNMQMHAVAYRRENLIAMGYRQTEGISYTDQQWIFIPMISVRTVARFGIPVYEYMVGRSGQTVDPSVKARNVGQTARCVLDMAVQYECVADKVAGRPVREYLYSRITPLLKEVYVFSLIHYGTESRECLTNFDNDLKSASKALYRHVGDRETSSFLGFEYITYWRSHRNANAALVRLLSRVYLLMLKMKGTRRDSDPMSLPVSF